MACRNNISGMSNDVVQALNKRIPLMPSIPAVLLALGAKARKGLNKSEIASKIISKFDQFGIPSGPNEDGSQNTLTALTAGIVEGIIDSICEDSKVSFALPPMGISIMGTGANAGGPVVVKGGNDTFTAGDGIVQ